MKTGTGGEAGTSQSHEIVRLQQALAESEASARKEIEIFAVDRSALRCYKPLKGKLSGGESPIELLTAVRE